MGRGRDKGFEGVALAGATLMTARVGAKLADVVTLAVLGRILVPADFGLVAAAMVFVLVAEGVSEIPLGAALVRERTLPRRLFDTAFTLALLRGGLVGLALLATAWPAARLLSEPRLLPLIAVLAFAPAARGLFSPRLAVYARRYDHRAELVIEIAGKLAGLLVAASLAVATRSYWAIAAGTLAAPIVSAGLSYALAPYRPRLRLAGWRRFAGLLGWNTVAQAAATLSWQLDRLLLAGFAGPALLGRYAVAGSLSGTVHQSISVPIGRPLTAAFAAARRDADRAVAYLTALRGIATIVAPVAVGFALTADLVVLLLLGEGWTLTAALFGWLSLAGLLSLASQPVWGLAVVLDETRFLARKAAIELAVRAGALAALLPLMGVFGAVAAQALVLSVGSACAVAFARRRLDLSVRAQFAQLARPALAAAAMAGTYLLIEAGLPTDGSLAARLAQATVSGGGALLAYLAVIVWCWRRDDRPDGIEAVLARRLPSPTRKRAPLAKAGAA